MSLSGLQDGAQALYAGCPCGIPSYCQDHLLSTKHSAVFESEFLCTLSHAMGSACPFSLWVEFRAENWDFVFCGLQGELRSHQYGYLGIDDVPMLHQTLG